jgi:RimJ/RimL family protein N-acetyltransferase
VALTADPPYRIRTPRLVIRCWEPRDAPLLKEAVDSSIEHLRAWMPWAWNEPKPLADTVALLRQFRGSFDLGQDFVYGLLDRDETEVVGGSGFHTRVGEDAFEIGYWVRAGRVGAGLATEATAALTRVGFEVCGVDRIEIRVEPGNEPSIAIPRKLGYREEARLRRRLEPRPGESARRDAIVFTMFADEYPATPSVAVSVEAWGALGERVL